MWEKKGEIKGDFPKEVAFDPPLNGRQSLSRWSWGARAFQAGRMAWTREGSWEEWSFHEQGRPAGPGFISFVCKARAARGGPCSSYCWLCTSLPGLRGRARGPEAGSMHIMNAEQRGGEFG